MFRCPFGPPEGGVDPQLSFDGRRCGHAGRGDSNMSLNMLASAIVSPNGDISEASRRLGELPQRRKAAPFYNSALGSGARGAFLPREEHHEGGGRVEEYEWEREAGGEG